MSLCSGKSFFWMVFCLWLGFITAYFFAYGAQGEVSDLWNYLAGSITAVGFLTFAYVGYYVKDGKNLDYMS